MNFLANIGKSAGEASPEKLEGVGGFRLELDGAERGGGGGMDAEVEAPMLAAA